MVVYMNKISGFVLFRAVGFIISYFDGLFIVSYFDGLLTVLCLCVHLTFLSNSCVVGSNILFLFFQFLGVFVTQSPKLIHFFFLIFTSSADGVGGELRDRGEHLKLVHCGVGAPCGGGGIVLKMWTIQLIYSSY